MVLKPGTSTFHHEGIKDGPTTNLHKVKFASCSPLPLAKRVRREDSFNDCKQSSGMNSTRRLEDLSMPLTSDILLKDEIQDSEDEQCDESHDHSNKDIQGRQVTELESALLHVRADRKAISEYESLRAAEHEDLTDTKKDLIPRGSIYVDAFNLSLDTVLEDERHLFNDSELAVFRDWRKLPYEAQYLYVRLFLRKTSSWHRLSRLGYWDDISDLPQAVGTLQLERELPIVLSTICIPSKINPRERVTETEVPLGKSFTFADTSDDSIMPLEEATSVLKLGELKSIAKDAKVQGRNKSELLKAFRRMSQRQSGLGWAGFKRSDSEINTGLDNPSKDSAHDFGDGNRDRHFVRKILSSIGPCIRLSTSIVKIFERVQLIFFRSTEWTERSLTTIILARMSKRNFPKFIVSRSWNVFPSRRTLLEYEAAVRTQYRVDSILECNGNPTKAGLDEILLIFEELYPRWQVLLNDEQRKEDREYEGGEGAYLRRFSPAWVYTRIVHKATSVLGKYKMHAREHDVLWSLLNQSLFHAARRGAWYQRAALLEEHYMSDLKPVPDIEDILQQKKHWKRTALKTCEQGLRDPDVHLVYHYDLQKRIRKLERTMRIAKREQHDFGHVTLMKPIEREVLGIKVQEEYSSTPRERFQHDQPRLKGTKTIWIDELEGGGECSVEAMCLSWYRSQDTINDARTWKGYHTEGGILRTLFAYLFHDILFLYVPNVFQTPYQTCPLDLHTDSFYASRSSEINHRLVEIENGKAQQLIRTLDSQERENRTCIVGLNWDFELNDLIEIVACFEGTALASVCKVMAQEYQQRGGGVPDLFLWNAAKNEVMFAEVKSMNDRLSDTQRLWIHVLMGAGIRVELCNAVAKQIRLVKRS
ncbi:MAG: hypothetical protein M1818_001461 [Claussenomyces sp. TS43310]|nr:MAG: hypothetical protein M1818_001461 [Claussenomyces sp. TS43310]